VTFALANSGRQKHAGQDGVRFVPLAREKQKAAVAFLNAKALQTPKFVRYGLRPFRQPGASRRSCWPAVSFFKSCAPQAPPGCPAKANLAIMAIS